MHRDEVKKRDGLAAGGGGGGAERPLGWDLSPFRVLRWVGVFVAPDEPASLSLSVVTNCRKNILARSRSTK